MAHREIKCISSGFSFMPLVQKYFHNSWHFSAFNRFVAPNKVSLKQSTWLSYRVYLCTPLNKIDNVFTLFSISTRAFFISLNVMHFRFAHFSHFDCRRRRHRRHRRRCVTVLNIGIVTKASSFFFLLLNKGTQNSCILHLIYFRWFVTMAKRTDSKWHKKATEDEVREEKKLRLLFPHFTFISFFLFLAYAVCKHCLHVFFKCSALAWRVLNGVSLQSQKVSRRFSSEEKIKSEWKNCERANMGIMSSFWKNKPRTCIKWDILRANYLSFDLNKCIKCTLRVEKRDAIMSLAVLQLGEVLAHNSNNNNNNWLNVIAIFEAMSADIKFQSFALYLVHDPPYQMFIATHSVWIQEIYKYHTQKMKQNKTQIRHRMRDEVMT